MRHIIKQDQPILSCQFCKDPKLFLLKNYKTTSKFYSTEFQVANFAELPNGFFCITLNFSIQKFCKNSFISVSLVRGKYEEIIENKKHIF